MISENPIKIDFFKITINTNLIEGVSSSESLYTISLMQCIFSLYYF
ncbi:hypothetical protein VAFE106499_07705 [Vagococcus fessus]